MSLETVLRDYLAGLVREAPHGPPREDEPLLSSGRLDSLDLLQVLAFLEERFAVDLRSGVDPGAFDTIAGLADAVRRARGR